VTTFLAIGGHIGDMDLTAGPLLAEAVLRGHRAEILALTPGERGHPTVPPAEYRAQKIAEGAALAAAVGAGFRVFDDQSDGFLGTGDDLAERVAEVIREVEPDVVVSHWHRSIHSDHTNAALLAERGRFLAGLPRDGVRRHGVRRLVYAENWEDAEGFEIGGYVPISDEAFERWLAGIEGQAFARGETYGFRYIDYYSALMTVRGCMARSERAVALGVPTGADRLDLL
jgi:LmbE family N-acetylglucosaminyl deacetylase